MEDAHEDEVGQCAARRRRRIPFTAVPCRTTASASARIVNETRESGQSIGHRARVLSAVSPAVFRKLRALQIPFLSLSLLYFSLSLLNHPLSLPHTYAHTKWTVLSFSLTLLTIQDSETRFSQPRAVRCSHVVGLCVAGCG